MFANPVEIENYINEFDFPSLLREMGWNYFYKKLSLEVNDVQYEANAVAEKCGVVVFCIEYIPVPDRKILQQIQRKLSEFYHENILIFRGRKGHLWQWVSRANKERSAIQYIIIHRASDDIGEFQNTLEMLSFSIEDEEDLTIVDVISKIEDVFAARHTLKFISKKRRQNISSEIATSDPNHFIRVEIVTGEQFQEYEAVYRFSFIDTSSGKRIVHSLGTPLVGIVQTEMKTGWVGLTAKGNYRRKGSVSAGQANFVRELLKTVRNPEFQWGVTYKTQETKTNTSDSE